MNALSNIQELLYGGIEDLRERIDGIEKSFVIDG
jgi:hypothetical protein